MTLMACAAMFCGCDTNRGQSSATAGTDSTAVRNEVMENILQRRSIRKYKPQSVEEEKMARIVECGIHAPNGQGRQSWEVRIVDNPRLLAEIDSVYGRSVGAAGDKQPAARAAYGAPVLAFIAYDTTYDLSQVDCGLLGENMMLAAQSMGIGSCCLGGICRFLNGADGTDLLRRLDFPETHRLLYAIAFGYPDETPEVKPRDTGKVRYVE